MRSQIKVFIAGFVIGGLLAFPLGMNFGRGDPLLSNPFANRDVTTRVKRSVKEKTEKLMEGAKEQIHKATKPERED